MAGNKRRSNEFGSQPAGKRARRDITPVAIDDDEDDLEAILAQIKQQEESEALARKLQEEWSGPSTSTNNQGASGSKRGQEVIVLDGDEDEGDGDGATANRLSREWQKEGLIEVSPPAQPARPSPKKVVAPIAGPSRTSRSLSLPEQDVTPDVKLLEFRELFTAERDCSKCGKTVKSPRGHVVFSSTLPPPSLLSLLHAPCSSCRTNHCRGCFARVSCPPSCKGKGSKDAKCGIDSCCPEVRAIALFEALGGFDRQFIGERATSDSRAQAAAAKQKRASANSVGPGGTGYGMEGSSGYSGHHYGYSGGRGRGRGRSTSDQFAGVVKKTRAESLAEHWEEIVIRALTTFTDLLPSPYAESPKMYDMLPHASIGPLLSLSQLPELLGSLLRNDSVTDWIARSQMYHVMIALLRRMADCELTVEVLIGWRWEKNRSCGLEEWMWEDGEIVWETNKDESGVETPERVPALYEHFRKLTKQCEAFLAGASLMMNDQDDEDGGDVEEMTVKATSLCGDIIAARDDIERTMAALGKGPSSFSHASAVTNGGKGKQGKGKGRDLMVDMEKTYSLECERLAFRHVSLSEISPTDGSLVYARYSYAQDLTQTASMTRLPKGRLHLVKELAVMATCLPPGVWVRVDEVRNDAIKIMIAGPDETPYAGGLFEFDCFMPLGYPNKPPLLNLRTTGGGRVRFNPNLYAEGKVCLSLLGTWPGRPEEQWSLKSTLLQVLVSIQSMILIDAPYFNEPGHGRADPKSSVSITYNRNIALQTVRWGMVEWLKDEQRDGIWGDVIASHFSVRKDKIRKCIQQWATDDPRVRKYHLSSTCTAGAIGAMLPSSSWTRQAQTSASETGAMDLLTEFDHGIRRVEQWPKKMKRLE